MGDNSARSRSTINQSFSHGRTRTVEVERKSSRQGTQSGRPIIHLRKKKRKKKKKGVAAATSTGVKAAEKKLPPKRTVAKPSFRNSLPGGSLVPALQNSTGAQKHRSRRGGRWVNPTRLSAGMPATKSLILNITSARELRRLPPSSSGCRRWRRLLRKALPKDQRERMVKRAQINRFRATPV